MGHKLSRGSTTTSKQNAFKLFEYACPCCKSKRPIQYFYKDGRFLPQNPRVVCGECRTSVTVQPFKTVDYSCPACKKWQRVRLPAKPIPLNMYNVSVATCSCGFRGEVQVGRLMDVVCSDCMAQKKELRDVWTEDCDEVRVFCGGCQDYKRAYARTPQKKAAEEKNDLEYTCGNCSMVRPITAEDLLRNQGLAICSLCNWVEHPSPCPAGQSEKTKAPGDRRGRREKPDKQSGLEKSRKQVAKETHRGDMAASLTSVLPGT